MHIELYLRKAHTQKPLAMLGESILNNNSHYSWRHVGRANPKGVRLVSEDKGNLRHQRLLKTIDPVQPIS